jgi:hypothetical protein
VTRTGSRIRLGRSIVSCVTHARQAEDADAVRAVMRTAVTGRGSTCECGTDGRAIPLVFKRPQRRQLFPATPVLTVSVRSCSQLICVAAELVSRSVQSTKDLHVAAVVDTGRTVLGPPKTGWIYSAAIAGAATCLAKASATTLDAVYGGSPEGGYFMNAVSIGWIGIPWSRRGRARPCERTK